jgi:hypothetical protein
MISVLFAAACAAYNPADGSCDRMGVLKAQEWDGPTASLDCDAELRASRQRLDAEGLHGRFRLWCETDSTAE